MNSFKFAHCLLRGQQCVNRAKLGAAMPKMKCCFSLGSKRTRWKSLDNIRIITGTAAGILVCVIFHRTQVYGKENPNYKNSVAISTDDGQCVIGKSRELLRRLKDEVGIPGLVVGVSIDGETIWEEGFGYSDVENRVHCTPDTVMRIASISKSITMAAIGKLFEDGKLDLDKSVQHYVPEFPQKSYNGTPVDITCRHLVSHLGGIRHYDKKNSASSIKNQAKNANEDELQRESSALKKETGNGKTLKEFEHKEYYIKEKYPDVKSSLNIFKDDSLVSKPGNKFYYSTHGWTLLSAVVENVSGEPFTTHLVKLCKKLELKHTYLDVNDELIYNRSRNYSRDKHGRLINSPYVDNSYKWAGGGLLSTVGDLLKFGNSMLYSLQYKSTVIPSETSTKTSTKVHNSTSSDTENSIIHEKSLERKSKHLPGYLSKETVKLIWTPVVNMKDKDTMYAMGWTVMPEKNECGYCHNQRFYASHTGGAIGASSVLLILPKQCSMENSLDCVWSSPPKGVVVSIITNLQEISLSKVALEIALLFDNHD